MQIYLYFIENMQLQNLTFIIIIFYYIYNNNWLCCTFVLVS